MGAFIGAELGVLALAHQAVDQQERLITLIAELKKALLRQLFTQGLSNEPQKLSDIGPVPESWGLAKLSEVCTFQSGGTPSKQRADYWEGTIPWVSPKDMKRPRLTDVIDHISQEALEEGSKLAPAGSVFVVVRGMILAKDIPVALAEVPMAINQDMKAIIPGTRLHPDFLLYAMSAFKKRLFEKVGRSAHGTMTLMSTEITSFQIPMPDKKTQHQIANILATLEKKQELHQRKHATLTYFDVTGRQMATAVFRLRIRTPVESGQHLDLTLRNLDHRGPDGRRSGSRRLSISVFNFNMLSAFLVGSLFRAETHEGGCERSQAPLLASNVQRGNERRVVQ